MGKKLKRHLSIDGQIAKLSSRGLIIEDGSVCKGVLNQKEIQEQICDILEDGKDAFEKRRKKYFKV